MNRCCGVNAASLCERGNSQPPKLLPLPVWEDILTQIIHVNEFMSSITSTRRRIEEHCPKHEVQSDNSRLKCLLQAEHS